MNFKLFRQQLNKRIEEMIQEADHLFVVNVEKDNIWEMYLSSFPEGTNPIYRERTEHDCSCCKHFVKNFGRIVTIKNGVVKTIWEIDAKDPTYQVVTDSLANYVKSQVINDIFVTDILTFGTDHSIEMIENNPVIYDHFSYTLPKKFKADLRGTTLDTIKGEFKNTYNVFKNSLESISRESIDTVLELIAQNSLYKGAEHKGALESFLTYKKKYDKLSTENARDLFAWENSVICGGAIARIKNHSIGVLLTDITDGMNLNTAVTRYEKIVAPTNYKRPKAVFTKKMIEAAQAKIEDLGFTDSLNRRHAEIDDITVNNILFVDRDTSSKVQGATDVFNQLKSELPTVPKNLDKVEEVTIDKFIKDILPISSKVEALFESKHKGNLMSLIAPLNKDSKNMFKWDNNFSWSYSGNITDSLKEQVKAAGGKVDGVLRFSIRWNDGTEMNPNDFDAHCITPENNMIYFQNTKDYFTGGNLDVDIVQPIKGKPAVENITFPQLDKLIEGNYIFFVHCFSQNGGKDGFTAEIEFDGQIHQFEYDKTLRSREKVQVAVVNYSKAKGFTIKNALDSSLSQKEIWNVKTNTFVPVNIIMNSPNYWNEQEGIGNKHYFFMMNNCVNPEKPSGFFNEYLNNELNPHRKVLEALSNQLRVEGTDNQLSGLGFSSTMRNVLVCRVTGQTTRIIKIKF